MRKLVLGSTSFCIEMLYCRDVRLEEERESVSVCITGWRVCWGLEMMTVYPRKISDSVASYLFIPPPGG